MDSARKGYKRGVFMVRVELMREIAKYDEVDWKAMMEIIAYLQERY